jgi:adenine-specific DNA-methyltransferase
MRAYRDAGFRIVGHFVFPKRYTSSTRFLPYQHECAHLLAKGNPKQPQDTIGDVIDWTYSGNKAPPDAEAAFQGTVLDPFAGSGSTLLAARTLGRSYYGIELDPKYHAIASRRMEQAGSR